MSIRKHRENANVRSAQREVRRVSRQYSDADSMPATQAAYVAAIEAQLMRMAKHAR
jgi:hypothetical protein